jgi:photosystem II stability/assembly factor-like uncharacterized protein
MLVGPLVAIAAIAAVAVALSAGRNEDSAAGDASSAATIADVHGVAVNPADGALYIATHTGLFRSAKGESSARRVEAPEQDLMGFSVAGADRFVASGHPGPGQDLPPALGLIESRDGGRTWRSLSLQGEADFHLLRAAGDTVYAFDGRLRVSRDGGRNWQELTSPGELADIAPNPGDPDRVLASTSDGLRLSDDGGRSWTKGALDPPALLAWGGANLVFALGGDGTAYASTNGGRTWNPAGAVEGPPAAFTADASGTVYVARQDGSVDASSDRGRTWRPRSRN